MLECEGGGERSGLYYTCINSYLAPDEVAYIVNDCEARVVVTSAAQARGRDAAARAVSRTSSAGSWSTSTAPTRPFEPY